MTPADFELPDDVDALKAMIMAMSPKAARADVLEDEVADLKARNADADEQIAKLKLILKAFNRYRYGRRSEKQGKPIAQRLFYDFGELPADLLVAGFPDRAAHLCHEFSIFLVHELRITMSFSSIIEFMHLCLDPVQAVIALGDRFLDRSGYLLKGEYLFLIGHDRIKVVKIKGAMRRAQPDIAHYCPFRCVPGIPKGTDGPRA